MPDNAPQNQREVLTIDGGTLEGGGQVVRLAVALAVLCSRPISITNVRKNRRGPGLKAQHAAGLRLAAEICSGVLTGCSIGSSAVEFYPGPVDPSKAYVADSGTAGATSLLLQIALPCLLFSPTSPAASVSLTLRGGTNATQAPQVDYTEHVLLPFLRHHLHLAPELTVRTRGYYPKGGGEIHLALPTTSTPLSAFSVTNKGQLVNIKGRAWAAGLPRSLAVEMQAAATGALLSSHLGITEDMISIEAVREKSQDAVGSGSGILLWAETDEGCRFAGGSIGRKGRDPPEVGQEAAQELIRNLSHGGCVDEYLQDQIVVFMALAKGKSTVKTGPLTLHTRTAIWAAECVAGAQFVVEDGPGEVVILTCEGIGFTPQSVLGPSPA